MCNITPFFFDNIIATITLEDLDFTWSSYTGWDGDCENCEKQEYKDKKCKSKCEDKQDNKDRDTCYKCGRKTDILMGDMGSVWHYCRLCKL